jgi:hypothetical protein
MLNNEVIYDYQSYDQYYPKSWREEIRSLSLEDQYSFDCARFHQFKDESLVHFLKETEELSQLSALDPPKFADFDFDGKTTFKIKGKKLHEITQILGLLDQHKERIEGPLLDIGGGVGHLARIITTHLQIPAISLDQNAQFHEQGLKRLQRYPLPEGSKPLTFITGSFASYEETAPQVRAVFQNQTFSLGLHTCGPLSLYHFEHCLKSKGVGLLNFGCCYLKLNPETETNLSEEAKNLGLKLGTYALTLASRGNNYSSFADFVTKVKVKKFRYLIHLVQAELLNLEPLYKVGETHKSFYHGPFSLYAERKLRDLQMPSLSLEVLQNFHDDPKTEFKFQDMFAANLIRWRLGRLAELYLLLDRKLYLEEKGLEVEMLPLFDEAISPRNIGLLAFRKENSL